jgi:hypothetical protein
MRLFLLPNLRDEALTLPGGGDENVDGGLLAALALVDGVELVTFDRDF